MIKNSSMLKKPFKQVQTLGAYLCWSFQFDKIIIDSYLFQHVLQSIT